MGYVSQRRTSATAKPTHWYDTPGSEFSLLGVSAFGPAV
ncbi:MAG: hypothetical protein JWO59_2643 [Chloroflexi bacterium]|nr:hypothetical protein [Chloroflexota bacterium]